MPRLTIWALRAALLYFGIGFTFGGAMLFHKGVPFDPAVWRLLPVHVEFVLIGWTMQLAMAVAFWILPRLRRTDRYGSTTLAWIAFGLLNAGVLAVTASAWLDSPAALRLAGRALELTAALAFAVTIWPRVKMFGG